VWLFDWVCKLQNSPRKKIMSIHTSVLPLCKRHKIKFANVLALPYNLSLRSPIKVYASAIQLLRGKTFSLFCLCLSVKLRVLEDTYFLFQYLFSTFIVNAWSSLLLWKNVKDKKAKLRKPPSILHAHLDILLNCPLLSVIFISFHFCRGLYRSGADCPVM